MFEMNFKMKYNYFMITFLIIFCYLFIGQNNRIKTQNSRTNIISHSEKVVGDQTQFKTFVGDYYEYIYYEYINIHKLDKTLKNKIKK